MNVISSHISLALHSIMSKLKNGSIFSSDHIRSISKLAKIFITRMLEGDYFGSILEIFYVNVISPHITLDLH